MSANHANILVVTNDTFDRLVLQSPVPVVVDIWAGWCTPCRLLGPLLPKLAGDFAGQASIAKLDRDANDGENFAGKRYAVEHVPTLLLFKDGQLIDRFTGFAPYREFKSYLERLLAKAGVKPSPLSAEQETAFAAAAKAAFDRLETAMAPTEELMDAACKPVQEEYKRQLEATKSAITDPTQRAAALEKLMSLYDMKLQAVIAPFIEQWNTVQSAALIRYESEVAEATAAIRR